MIHTCTIFFVLDCCSVFNVRLLALLTRDSFAILPQFFPFVNSFSKLFSSFSSIFLSVRSAVFSLTGLAYLITFFMFCQVFFWIFLHFGKNTKKRPPTEGRS